MKPKITLKKIIFFLLLPFYLLFLFELFLLLAPPILSFIRDPRIFSGKTYEKKIYSLGDSFTYGLGLEREETYPSLLEEKLKYSPSEDIKGIAVVNMGKPALSLSTFYYEIKRLHETGQTENTIFILQGGWNCNDNDFIRFKKQQSKDFFTQFKLFLNNLRTFRIIKSYYLYKKIYYPYGTEDYVPPIMAMGHYNFNHYQKIAYEYLVKIAKYSQENNLKIIFLNYPQNIVPKNPKTDFEFYHYLFGHKKLKEEDYLIKTPEDEIAINRVIKYVSSKYQIPLVDINRAFEESGEKALFLDDYHHPNQEGAEIMAEAVYQKLIELKDFFY